MKIFRRNILNLLFLSVILFFISNQTIADSEKWKLTFKSKLTLNQGEVSYRIDANGSTNLTIDDQGVLTGSGTVSIVEVINGPNMSGISKGSGNVIVKGKRESEKLVFIFTGGTVNTNGSVSTGGIEVPFNNNYESSLFAPVETTIDRKNGAVSKHEYSVGGFTGQTDYTLSGGINIKTIPPPLVGTFPDVDNIWTLELDANWITNGKKIKMNGTADFPLPYDDGPAKGEGPLTLSAINAININGKLILDGLIINDTLRFVPKSTFEKGTAKTLGGIANLDYGQGIWAFDSDTVYMPVEDGTELVKDLTHIPSHTTGTLIFRLKGEKIERWRATISGWETLYFGSQVGGGIRVHWQIVVDFDIAKKKYISGSGTAKLTQFEEHSFPPGLYNCGILGGTYIDKNATKYNTPYLNNKSFKVPGKKSGSSATLYLPKELFYSVNYTCKLDEKGAEEAYKKDPSINNYYSSWQEWTKNFRKVVNDGGAREIPSGQISKTVHIPLNDGWTDEFGNSSSIDYEKIKVEKIK